MIKVIFERFFAVLALLTLFYFAGLWTLSLYKRFRQIDESIEEKKNEAHRSDSGRD